MKMTQQTSSTSPDIDQLVQLLASAHLLEEKTRVSLYLPKPLVKIIDELAQDQSRSEFIKNLVIDKAVQEKKQLQGVWQKAKFSEAEIDSVTRELDEVVDKLVAEL